MRRIAIVVGIVVLAFVVGYIIGFWPERRARTAAERDLMREFGVGRPAIREALAHLRNMGLVELRSGERPQVIRPTPEVVVEALSGVARHMLVAPDGARNFQNARLFFEIGLARHAAVNATKEDIDQLRSALEANHAALSDLDCFEKTHHQPPHDRPNRHAQFRGGEMTTPSVEPRTATARRRADRARREPRRSYNYGWRRR